MQEQDLIHCVLQDLDVLSLKPDQYVHKTLSNVPIRIHRVTDTILRNEYLLYIPTTVSPTNILYVLSLYPNIPMPLCNKEVTTEPSLLCEKKQTAQYIPISPPLYKQLWKCLNDQQPFPVCVEHLELASCYLIEVY